MGTATASEAESKVKIFWQDRFAKYNLTVHDLPFTVEEIKAPWDLYLEGRIFESEVGDTYHQTMVMNHMERIFSVRNEHGSPVCDIITQPEKGPILDFIYGPRRVFNTSAPMTVDGEKLIVLDVIGRWGLRSHGTWLRAARDFYLAMGGVLTEEHPNGLIYENKEDIKQWQRAANEEILLDLVIAAAPIPNLDKKVDKKSFHATTLEMSKALIDKRYWDTFFIYGEEPWAEDVMTYIEADPEAKPQNRIVVYGQSERARAIFQRALKVMGAEEKK